MSSPNLYSSGPVGIKTPCKLIYSKKASEHVKRSWHRDGREPWEIAAFHPVGSGSGNPPRPRWLHLEGCINSQLVVQTLREEPPPYQGFSASDYFMQAVFRYRPYTNCRGTSGISRKLPRYWYGYHFHFINPDRLEKLMTTVIIQYPIYT
jgi:hypothetical protein